MIDPPDPEIERFDEDGDALPYRLPPGFVPPAPVRWFLKYSMSVRLAFGLTYWLYMAATGLMAGFGLFTSLASSLVALIAVAGLFIGMMEARRMEWVDEANEVLWRIAAVLAGTLCLIITAVIVMVPAVILMVLGLWGLISLPLLLFRH